MAQVEHTGDEESYDIRFLLNQVYADNSDMPEEAIRAEKKRVMQEHLLDIAAIEQKTPSKKEVYQFGYEQHVIDEFWDSYNELVRQSDLLPNDNSSLGDKFESYTIIISNLGKIPTVNELDHPNLNLSKSSFSQSKNWFPSYSSFIYKAEGTDADIEGRPNLEKKIREQYEEDLKHACQLLEQNKQYAGQIKTKYEV